MQTKLNDPKAIADAYSKLPQPPESVLERSDAALDAALDCLSIEQRVAVKVKLMRAGLLASSVPLIIAEPKSVLDVQGGGLEVRKIIEDLLELAGEHNPQHPDMCAFDVCPEGHPDCCGHCEITHAARNFLKEATLAASPAKPTLPEDKKIYSQRDMSGVKPPNPDMVADPKIWAGSPREMELQRGYNEWVRIMGAAPSEPSDG